MDYSLPGSSCPWNFSGKDIGTVCHFPSLEDLLNPVMESAPASLASTALAGRLFTTSAIWEACCSSWETAGLLPKVTHSVVHLHQTLLPLRGLYPTRLLCLWDSLGKNTRVGSYSLLQGTFPTQGLNLHLLHCRQIFYHVSHQESPADPYWNQS